MAVGSLSRFWLVALVVSLGLLGLRESNLAASATTEESVNNRRETSENASVEAQVKSAKKEATAYDAQFAQTLSGFPEDENQPSPKCPVATPSLHPCTCRSLARGIVVDCAKTRSRNELVNALSDLRTYVMSETKLNGIEYELSNKDFDEMRFVSLQFARGNIRINGENGSFSFGHLTRSKTALKSVHFVGCSINLGDTTVAKAPTLLYALDFLESYFTGEFKESWFENLRVEQLRISNSKKITYPIASLLSGLKVYEHSKCALKSISRDLFPKDLSQLQRLDFSDNELSTLPQGIFEGIPSLREVLLTANKFTALEQSIFEPVWSSMRSINVNGNYLLYCKNVQWLLEKPIEERRKVRGSCVKDDGLEIEFNE